MTKQEIRDKYARFESFRAQLATTFRGQIAIRGEPVFAKSITIFNDAAPLGGWIVAVPVDVQDISAVVKFCATHGLSPSIKSGGFATAGWAIQGEVVIDTGLMDDVKLLVPKPVPSQVGAAPDSSPLTLPAAGLATTYHPSALCANRSDVASGSMPRFVFNFSSSIGLAAPPAPPSAASATIDPITAQANSDSITLQSDSVSAADRFTVQQNHNPSATPIHAKATMPQISKVESSEDVDPQDVANNALKRKARESDEAFLATVSDIDNANFTGSQYTSTAKRRTDDSNISYSALQDAAHDAKSQSQSMQQGRSHESGADADSESSYASSTHQDQDQDRENENDNAPKRGDGNNPAASSLTNSEIRGFASSSSDFLDASEPRDAAPLYPTAAGTGSASGSGSGSGSSSSLPSVTPVPAKIWVDRQLDLSGNASDSPGGGSNSGSNGGGSSSHLASSFTSASKQSSAKSSNAGGDHADTKADADAIGGVTTDDVGDESLPFKRPSMISMPKRERESGLTSQRRLNSRSGSGSGSASDSGRYRRCMSNSETPDDWDMSASAEHQRWHRHHRPPSGTPGEKLKLPQGGFVWRSDGADAGISNVSAAPGSLPWDAEAFAASPEAALRRSSSRSARSSSGEGSSNEMETRRQNNRSGYFGASTLSDLQDAWSSGTWAVNQDASNDPASNLPRFIPSPLQKYGSPSPTPQLPDASNPYNFDSRSDGQQHQQAASILPPGVYQDRYALASFGPGVGIRGLDAFTDRAGREGNFLAAMDEKNKGKARQVEQEDAMPPLVVNGVPYHVPVSAYPVGSTAMTTGGFGYLMRAYGLSLDNITEVEMVLADGRIMTLNEESKHKSQEEQDLWWAVRGAAPCFGIVTRLTAKAYPVPSVYSGNLIYPLNPATASSLIRHWRDCLKAGLPRNFYTNLILTAGPSKTSHVIVIQVCYLGPKSDGEALVQAISSWTGERLLLKDVEERSFLSQQDGVAKVLKGGTGRRWMVRGDLISTLTDDVIAKSVRNFQGLGSRAVWLFELMGGAVEDSPADETCISPEARSAKFTVGSLQQWSGKAEDRNCIESVERWLNEVVDKVSVGGPYPCFLGRSERMDRVIGAYGLDNFRRLLEIKKRVDPNNMFRHTFGHGFVVDDPEKLLQELDERQTQRRRVQAAQAEQAAQANGQTLSSQE